MDVRPNMEPEPPPEEETEGGSGPLTVPEGFRPEKVAEVLELDMGDGLILYNHDSSLVHHLNPSAALVWKLCDGAATVGQLAKEIAEEYALEADKVREQLASVVAEFDALDLVRDARDLLRKDASDLPQKKDAQPDGEA
jgi:PqqD family protein of HPr-rel-A system